MAADRGRSDADVAGEGGPGDVEQAGETTAASAIEGPEDDRPVGEGTRVEVADEPDRESGAGSQKSE